MNESPAPTVSLMTTLGAGAHTRLPLSQSAAPSAALVTQMRGVLVAFAKAAQASARASGLRGVLSVASPVLSQEASLPTSSSLSLMTSARFAMSMTSAGSAKGGRRFTSKNFMGAFDCKQAIQPLLEKTRGGRAKGGTSLTLTGPGATLLT